MPRERHHQRLSDRGRTHDQRHRLRGQDRVGVQPRRQQQHGRVGEQPQPRHQHERRPERGRPASGEQAAEARSRGRRGGRRRCSPGLRRIDHVTPVVEHHPDRQRRARDEQRSPAPGRVLLRPEGRQQRRDGEGDRGLRPRRHREDHPAHQSAPPRRRPLHRQRDRRRVLAGHEDPAEEAQRQDQRDRARAEHLVGGDEGDRERARRGARDRETGGAGAPHAVRDPPEHHPADGPAQQHRDDDQRRRRRGRRRARDHEHRRGQRRDRQEHVDVVDEVPDHAGAQRGPTLGRQGAGAGRGDRGGGHRVAPARAGAGETAAASTRRACSKNSSS